jgi:hypothetical protein
MVKRVVGKVIHSLAVRVFATLEVLGIPRTPDEGEAAPERGSGPDGAVEG